MGVNMLMLLTVGFFPRKKRTMHRCEEFLTLGFQITQVIDSFKLSSAKPKHGREHMVAMSAKFAFSHDDV